MKNSPGEPPPSQRDPRVEVRVPVRISTIDAEHEPSTGKPYFRTSQETCADLSRSGVFVPTTDGITPGRRLLLELDIPGGPRIQAIGRVAWSKVELPPSGIKSAAPDNAESPRKGSGMGIELLGGSPEHLSALAAFVRRASRPRSAPRRVRPVPHTAGPA